jgi:secondary thiamine-phosphate synthase enzyme
MQWRKDTIQLSTHGKGLYTFTDQVEERIRQWGVKEGMCFLYLPHTSASLVVNESYDPTARQDMETIMEKLVPENQPWHEHTLEGPDDTTSHMRAMLTLTSLSIPIDGGELGLGRWQGVYLFEHRSRGQSRQVLLRCLGI